MGSTLGQAPATYTKSKTSDTSSSREDVGQNFVVDVISKAAETMGLTESKKNRIIQNIEKIKNLL